MEIQNDYRLLYLYHLANNEGKLKDKHKAEYERLMLLYSIDEAERNAKKWLLKNEHIYSTQEGYLEDRSWVLTKEDKENPFKITQKGLDALDKKVFESETAKQIAEKGEKRLSRFSIMVGIAIGCVTLFGWFWTEIGRVFPKIYEFICNLFV